ncbi:MAG: hypothetical protein R3F24_14875 [Gammaproteobacteria bacterium]
MHGKTLRLRPASVRGNRQVISLEANDLRWRESALGNLSAQLSGVADDHELSLALTDGEVALKLRSSGAWRSGVLTEQRGRRTST